MSKKILKGRPLIDAIHEKKRELGVTTQEIAQAIQLSPPYMQAVLSGTRPIQSISDDAKRRLAQWLGVSTADVYIMAEILEPSDFLVEEDLGDRLRLTLLKMRMDPIVKQFAPTKEEWEALPARVRFFMCMTYERMTEKEILRKIERCEWSVEDSDQEDELEPEEASCKG